MADFRLLADMLSAIGADLQVVGLLKMAYDIIYITRPGYQCDHCINTWLTELGTHQTFLGEGV